MNNTKLEHYEIAIVLPAFNEESTIATTAESFHKILPYAKIFIIDNNSSDNTKIIAEKLYLEKKIPGRLLSEPKQGKACAMKKAFKEIDADIVVMADADNTYPAEEIKKLILPIIEEKQDLIIGARINKDNRYHTAINRPLHKFGNFLVSFLTKILFKKKINDVLSGYRALSRNFINAYQIKVKGFEIETDMTIFAILKNYKIKEVNISYNERPENSLSKLKTFKDGFLIIKRIFILFIREKFNLLS